MTDKPADRWGWPLHDSRKAAGAGLVRGLCVPADRRQRRASLAPRPGRQSGRLVRACGWGALGGDQFGP
jgi:hypothetical protein